MNRIGTVFIGQRNAGKTTQLYAIYKEAVEENKRILVIDSATDHEEKSLLRKIQKEQQHILIDTCDESQIVFPNITKESYPSYLLRNHNEGLYLCDASYYLEKGYGYPEGVLREEQRKLYKYFSMQVISVMLDRVDAIIMDEIELLPEFRENIEKILYAGVSLSMALHEEVSLSGLDDLFRIVRL